MLCRFARFKYWVACRKDDVKSHSPCSDDCRTRHGLHLISLGAWCASMHSVGAFTAKLSQQGVPIDHIPNVASRLAPESDSRGGATGTSSSLLSLRAARPLLASSSDDEASTSSRRLRPALGADFRPPRTAPPLPRFLPAPFFRPDSCAAHQTSAGQRSGPAL